MIPFIWGTQNRQMHRESRIVVTGNWQGEENDELLFNGYRVSVQNDENILEMNDSDDCTYECTEYYTH